MENANTKNEVIYEEDDNELSDYEKEIEVSKIFMIIYNYKKIYYIRSFRPG